MWDSTKLFSNLMPEGQGQGIIMGVTRLLLLGQFYTIQTQTDQTFWRGVYHEYVVLNTNGTLHYALRLIIWISLYILVWKWKKKWFVLSYGKNFFKLWTCCCLLFVLGFRAWQPTESCLSFGQATCEEFPIVVLNWAMLAVLELK